MGRQFLGPVSLRRALTAAAAAAAVSTALGVIEPSLTVCRRSGLLLCLAALVADRVLGSRASIRWLGLLTACFGLASGIELRFGADSLSYFAYLRSASFDLDLDFANEWRHWGIAAPSATATGKVANFQSIGPALVWSPFYALAHVFVLLDRAFGAARYAADGFASPYLRATAVGTLSVAVCGAGLLARALRARHGGGPAALAVFTAVVASPVLYYAFVSPAMAHGSAFGVAAALVWALLRARGEGSRASWAAVGLCWGLLTAIRWQALVYALLVAPVALASARAGRVRMRTLLLAAAAALAAASPQLVAWRLLYGRFVTLPQGGAFVDWSSPHLFDTLFSANHGLFSWTPAMLLGVVGLVLGLRAEPVLNSGALAVFAATAWVNGGVADWWGSDAFGARRFTLVVPLLAIGLAELAVRLAVLARRAPLALPALVLGAAALLNAGFVAAFRATRYPDAAPLERVAADRASILRRAAEELAGALGGPHGRAVVYRVLSGEYLFGSFNPTGTLRLADLDGRDLAGRWAARRRLPDGPSFRWALPPRSCVRLPLDAPFALRVLVTARARSARPPQRLDAEINGQRVASRPLPAEWTELDLTLPTRFLQPGENWLCFRFGVAGRDDEDPVAAVASVQVLAATPP